MINVENIVQAVDGAVSADLSSHTPVRIGVDEDEWERRLPSACLYDSLDPALIMPQVHFIYREDDRITFGTNSSEFLTPIW